MLISFLFLDENIYCGYSLEVPQWDASNEYHNICFRREIRKILCGYPLLSVAMILESILQPTFLKTGLELFLQHFIPVEHSINTFTLWPHNLDHRPINCKENHIPNFPLTHCPSDFSLWLKKVSNFHHPCNVRKFFHIKFGYSFNIFLHIKETCALFCSFESKRGIHRALILCMRIYFFRLKCTFDDEMPVILVNSLRVYFASVLRSHFIFTSTCLVVSLILRPNFGK